MPVRLFLASQIVRFQMRRRFARAGNIEPLRAMMTNMARTQPTKLPAGVRVEPMTLGGVTVEKLAVVGAADDAAILYLHGGAFIAGAPENHRALTWRFAQGCGVAVYAPDYRLAPEHRFPAGLDDCVAVYRALVERGVKRIAIGGDSAGGNLTLATALEVARLGLPRPVALACLSAVVTLAEDLPSVHENRDRDAMFPPGMLPSVNARYAPGADLRDPRLSPLYAKDPSVLPPTIFQVGESETLRDHSVQMSARMRAAGVTTQLEVVPGAFHVWQLAADQVPEAKTAVERLVAFVGPRLRTS